MNINIGDGFSANINTIDQKVEIDYKNIPIESASFSSIGNFFSSVGTHIANFFTWFINNCTCVSICVSDCCKKK